MKTKKGRLFQKLEIGVASPKQIRQWAERFLPNGEIIGEVTSWETVNYKTLKPEPNGLFCQKVFGPVVDFTCACGKKSTKIQRGFCPKCGVERTHSRVRRYRLGYIKLKQPVVHPLYASHRPSPLSLCLNWSTKRVQAVMKTSEFCTLSHTFTLFRSKGESRPFFKNNEAENSFDKITQGSNESQTLNSVYISKKEQPLENLNSKPRLFNKKTDSNIPFFIFNHGALETRLYGIAYDATWRQVEEFQEFLFYLWEQSFSYESGISYYAFTKPIKSWTGEIPKHDQGYAIQTGGFAFQHILSYLDVVKLQKELTNHYIQLQGYIRFIHERLSNLELNLVDERKEFKRLRIKLNRLQQLQLKCKRQIETFRDFEQAKMQPAWMILSYLPVLPPGLRPITSIRGELIVSDINTLYRKVLIRNKRITRGANFGVFDTALSGSWLSWCYNVRQVQEAVDELLKTGSIESGKPLKSLLEGLKGKQGRFRQHLLGKRVDYSGRSVIVVGPHLQIHQCGLPKQMAIELFQPFIIQKLRKKGIVFTTTAAKALIAERKPIVWSILGELLKTHPILLNRAPTLHRLGIQAFLPQLVEGKAILLHPLVCPAFNADFDGDQMAVHVPLSAATRAEALNLLWSRNHLLAPASGQPLLLPTQDMVLGFYYLTCSQEKGFRGLENLIPSRKVLVQNELFASNHQNPYFSSFADVKSSYDRGFLGLQTPIWVKWSGFVQTFVTEHQARTKDAVIETRLDLSGRGETVFLDNCYSWLRKPVFSTSLSPKKPYFVRTTAGRVLMHSWIFREQRF
uniref:DNA-directed RNA polymerase subunit n=1 Tax=Micractinium conductrix TaxID=554055 RepID=A0A2I4S7C0_9CHLO|nr:RNA polymerase beta [Micractinium conductrix]AST08940.1 RNA polymerase beta [Micractinium conductrix]